MRELVAFQDTHLEIMLAAERQSGEAPAVHGTFLIHIRTLLEQIDPRIDARVVAGLLLGAVAPRSLHRLTRIEGVSPAAVADAVVLMARGITSG
jgi:hypothetical protein